MSAQQEVVDALEALLFVADSPQKVEALAQHIDRPAHMVEDALDALGARLARQGGIQLIRIAGGYQLCTKPMFAEAVAKLVQPQSSQRLSRSAMETLAIVAYRQPVTAAEVEEIRGVQSDYSLKLLADRRFITEVGRRSTPGRPILYGTTQNFLHVFGLESLEGLPEIELEHQQPAIESEEQPALMGGESE